MQDSDVLEVIVNTSNNVSKALMLGRRMEKTTLHNQLEDIARQQKKSRLFIERHKQAFLQTYKGKRKDWWKYDTHVRENVRRDFDSVIINKVQEISSRSHSVDDETKKKSPRKLQNISPKSDGDADSDYHEKSMLVTENSNHKFINNIKPPKSLNNSINQTNSESGDENNIPSFNYFTPKKQVKDNQVMAYFKPNVSSKLPDIKNNQSLRKLSQTIHETPTETFQTKGVLYQNEKQNDLSNKNKNKNKRNSIKPDSQQQKHQLKLPKLTLKEASLSRFGMNTVSLTNLQRSEFINHMKSQGDINEEDEAFYDVISRFLKRSPFYVESKDKINAIESERRKTTKSIIKEKKISQTRDKRFDNLMRSLVDTH